MPLLKNCSLLPGFDTLALGDQHSMILKQNGSVWSTTIFVGGLFSSGGFKNRFAQVMPSDVTAAAAGSAFSIVVITVPVGTG